jgi:hypothetical protein
MYRMIRIGSLAVVLAFPALCFAFTGAGPGGIESFPQRNAPTLPFVANAGQVDERVAFHASIGKGTVSVTKDGGIVYFLRMPAGEGTGSFRRIVLQETVVGTHGGTPTGEKPVPAKVSYFRGNDPAKWRSGIPAFGAVSLGEVYDGIGLDLIATGRNVEKVFHVKPGGDPGEIRLRFAGAGAIDVDGTGELVLSTEVGPVRFTRPLAWQERDGGKVEVSVAYRILSAKAGEYGFDVSAYDRSKELIIDPLLASTYLGGSVSDFASAVAVDADGNVYVAGTTESPDFPITPGAVDNAFTAIRPDYNTEIFVSKFDRNFSSLLASTFLGGGSTDYGYAVALDNSGNVVVAGSTDSEDFPTTPGAYDNTYPGTRSAVVARLSGDLTTLLASTFLGGATGAQEAKALTIAPDGAVFVAGLTSALDFPVTPGALDNTLVFTPSGYRFDGFVSKFSGNLSTLLASTYLGGSQFDQVFSIALGPGGNVYVAGYTESPDFPTTPGAYDNTFNGVGSHGCPFVAKLNGTLTRIPASTFLGSTYYSYIDESIAVKQGFPVAVAGDGSVYVAGATVYPEDFPTTPGAFDNAILTTSSYDGFVARFDGDLTTLRASTFLRGGSGNDRPASIAVDAGGNVYVAGWTDSSNFPSTPGAFDNTGPSFLNSDGFVSRFDATLSHLLASTFLGGGAEDYIMPNALALDGDGYVYVAGATFSADFPVTPNAHGNTFNDTMWADAFVSKFSPTLSAFDPVVAVTDSVPLIRDKKVPIGNVTVGMAAGGTVTVSNIGNADLHIGTIGSGNPLAAPFAVVGDNCSGRTVSSGDNCSFAVRFSPVAQGDFLDTFAIPSNDPGTPAVTVTVSGTGVVPDISVADSISPANDRDVPFGDVEVGFDATATVTVTNVATMNNAILLVGAVGGADPLAVPFTVTSDNCSGRAFAPSASCSITVRFRPLAGGAFSDTLGIPSNDPDSPTVTVSLSGVGAVPDIYVTDSVPPAADNEVRFGNVVRHKNADQVVTATNIGRARLVIGPVGGADPLAAPFGIASDNCSGRTIAPAASCSIAVRFSPVAIGLFSDRFDVPSNDPDTPTVSIDVSGAGRVFPDPVPTPFRVLLPGTSTVKGATLSLNDEVAAWSVHPNPSGGGRWERKIVAHGVAGPGGALDPVPVYGDDPATPGVVEGAIPGEEICMALWRDSEGKVYWAYLRPDGSPGAWYWTGDGDVLPTAPDFIEGVRIPLRNDAWNLFSYGVLKGWHKGTMPPATAQLDNVAWEPVANVGEAFPLKSIDGKYSRVIGSDAAGAKFWNPTLPSISTLSYLAPGYGYWVKMKPSTDNQALAWMTVPGKLAAGSESLPLGAGWALTGYWGNERTYSDNAYDASGELLPVSASEVVPLASIGDTWASIAGSYVRVTSFDGQGAHVWNPSLPGFSTLKYIGPGYGYWIKAIVPVSLTYPPGTK